MVFYTNKFVDKNKAGKAIACFIFIRPEYKSDIGLLIHEETHVKQFWRNPFNMLFTVPNKKAILAREIEAYARQIEYYDTQQPGRTEYYVDFFTWKIFNEYDVDTTLGVIKDLLLQEIHKGR
jgi:hypothetical protein